MKVAIVTCKSDPDYIRARNLRTGFGSIEGVRAITVKNTHKGFIRYFETLARLIKTRFKDNPDVYVLTFRGYEMLFFVLLLAGRKPVIFDEFVNPIEWAIYEHHLLKRNGFLAKLLKKYYVWLVKHCSLILADTKPHAAYSSKLNGVSLTKYFVVPISADEKLFYPSTKLKAGAKKSKKFKVFNYGEGMLPLHGLNIVVEAAFRLRFIRDIEFHIASGSKEAKALIHKNVLKGANIKYSKWIKFSQLPRVIRSSDLVLGGPFGNSTQAKLIITGKTAQFLACGVPTVVGKTKASDIFTNRVDSFVIPQANSQELTKQILWAYQHRAAAKNIGKKGFKLYQKELSNKVVTDRCQQIVDLIR